MKPLLISILIVVASVGCKEKYKQKAVNYQTDSSVFVSGETGFGRLTVDDSGRTILLDSAGRVVAIGSRAEQVDSCNSFPLLK